MHLLLVHVHHQVKNLVQIYGIFIDRIEIILENNKKEIKAKCKICSKLLSGGSNSGTSHIKIHNE